MRKNSSVSNMSCLASREGSISGWQVGRVLRLKYVCVCVYLIPEFGLGRNNYV